MSKAYKCDRCGALFCFDITKKKYYITTSRCISGLCADLCDECQKQLDMFMTYKDAQVARPCEEESKESPIIDKINKESLVSAYMETGITQGIV